MEFLDKLLNYYGINKEEYLLLIKDVDEKDVPSFANFDNMLKAKDVILNAIKENQKILIYGDYDADGILATSILVNTFKKLKYEVDYYIPSRYLDGYGINEQKVIDAKAKGYQLIITVDNGITALGAIKKAKELGINMLITDHHEYQNEITDFIYLHPKKSQLRVTTSGAMVAFYLSYAILNQIDPFLLTLGATSIISDIMPMKEENRTIVKLALKYLNKYRFDKFNLLSEGYIYDESTLALKVIPKINAVGRIELKDEVNLLVKYFTTSSYSELMKIRDYLNTINDKRKALSLEVTNNLTIKEENAVVISLDILSGLTGLIANRLLSTYNLPSCVFSNEVKEGNIRGSIRSRNGFNVIDFINENKDMFIEQGGHELAAGVVIKQTDFMRFKEAFINYAKAHPFTPNQDNIEIISNEVNLKNYDIIRSFAPFGNLWKEPTFLIKHLDVTNMKRVGQNAEHLSLSLAYNVKVIGFHFDFTKISDKYIDVIGKFKINKFKNNVSVNFTLEN